MSVIDSLFFKKKEEDSTKKSFYKTKKESRGTGLTNKFLENLKPN